MLMREFFSAYFGGSDALDALRSAQRAMRATPNWERTIFLAGFVLEGGRPDS